MSVYNVRKSGRIKTKKKTSHLSDDFEYDENKFDVDDVNNFEIEAKSEMDISTNISELLNSHSKEADNEHFHVDRTSFPNVMRKLKKGESGELECDEGGNALTACPICDKHLSTEEDLESHMDEHKSENDILSCEMCGKILSDLASYNRHLKTHSSDRPFQCGQCEKSFMDSCSLKRHMKIHDDERPFSCEICHKSFRDTASISRHMLTHTDRPRMFQCLVCDKNFTDLSGLKRHKKTHSGIRPYVCEVCQKAFMDSTSFKRHQKIHIGIKNYHCPKCQRSFMEKQSLIRHQKTVCKFFDDSTNLHDSYNGDNDDSNPGNDSQIQSGEDNGQSFPVEEDKEYSNHSSSSDSLSSTSVKNSVSNSPSDSSLPVKSFVKGQPSLGSLIQKDPGLYDSISEIVESIDSYEKMLDLCGDQGQKEIEAALTRDPVPVPNNLLCFECGELLVDEVNFKSDGKVFHPSMTNAFKCLNCEEEDDDDDYGEPPVLMPQNGADHEDIANDDSSEIAQKSGEATENFYGTDEPIEQFQDRLKKQHGVYFVEDGYPQQLNENSKGDGTALSQPILTESDDSNSYLPVLNELTENQEKENKNLHIQDGTYSPSSLHESETVDHPKLEYEADDPNIPSVFPCHLCTKVFASSSFLAQHLALHKKSPHKCMVCTKTFTSGPALKRHMLMHTGEKPYACPFCQKQFRDPSNFGKHKKNCGASANSVPSPLGSCSTDLGHSSGSVENKQRKKATRNGKVGAHGGKNLKKEFEKVVDDESSNPIVFNYDDNDEEYAGGNVVDESLPIMAVMPSLDEDEMMDESLDGIENQEESVNIAREENLEDRADINYIPCEVCQKLCDNEQHLEMHMNYHTGNPNVTCIECGKTFADTFGMKRHMRTHLGTRPYTCEYCGRGYCDNWSLKKHKGKGCLKAEVKVPVDLLHPCPKCTRVFCDAEHVQEHTKVHKGLMKFECDVCNKRFSEAFNLKKHRRLHMAICPGCGMEFSNMKLLTAHQEWECTTSVSVTNNDNNAEDGKSFSCDDCGRVYSTRAYLDRHRKIHSELKPHVCEVCNKRFSEAFKLRRHQKASHSNEKPFVCQDCGKCFSDDASLKRHMVSSSCALSKVLGEPVSSETCACQLCDKVFQKNYMLVRHMTVHSQDRPFSCEVCGRSYKDTSSLKRHQMTHQGVKDFICPTCGKDFYYADSLKRHTSGRCGKKTKTRRRKGGVLKKAKKRGYPKSVIEKPDVMNYNNNNNNHNFDEDTLTSWKNKLHVSRYIPLTIPDTSSTSLFFAKRAKKDGKWSCRFKEHCWLCDIKVSSASALKDHRRIHLHEKAFSCRKCFVRFYKKIYWKAHTSSCRPVTSAPINKRSRLPRRRTAADAAIATANIISEEFFIEDGHKRRSRRSVPRAKWSWISQI